jgi:anion-transporting  ArsA/GET3 family ATPase
MGLWNRDDDPDDEAVDEETEDATDEITDDAPEVRMTTVPAEAWERHEARVRELKRERDEARERAENAKQEAEEAFYERMEELEAKKEEVEAVLDEQYEDVTYVTVTFEEEIAKTFTRHTSRALFAIDGETVEVNDITWDEKEATNGKLHLKRFQAITTTPKPSQTRVDVRSRLTSSLDTENLLLFDTTSREEVTLTESVQRERELRKDDLPAFRDGHENVQVVDEFTERERVADG